METLLAIDTSTATSSIALYRDREGVLAELTWLSPGHHTVELAPYVESLLKGKNIEVSDLSGVAVALGPGSFTGLRVGLSLSKGLALANDIPLFGIPTLDALAFGHGGESLPIWAIIQAGRGRICAARYETEGNTVMRTTDYLLTTLEGLTQRAEGLALFCGEIDLEGASLIRENLGERAIVASPTISLRRAAYVAEMAWKRFEKGEKDDPLTLEPLYLHYPKVPL